MEGLRRYNKYKKESKSLDRLSEAFSFFIVVKRFTKETRLALCLSPPGLDLGPSCKAAVCPAAIGWRPGGRDAGTSAESRPGGKNRNFLCAEKGEL